MEQTLTLLGSWTRLSQEPCSRVYPTSLVFRDDGLFEGTGGQPGDTPGWDRGTWALSGPHTVRISTIHDAIVAYEFTLSGDLLVFRDPGGCEFRYRRAGAGGTPGS